MKIFTIGHSNRSFEEFCKLLKHYGVRLVIDVRRFPSSRKYPHFNRDELEKRLKEECDVDYIYLGEELGGYRKGGYEMYMQTDEFKMGLGKLLFWAQDGVTAIMCSEKLWFKCHRRFIADRLVELGHEVVHIIDEARTQRHRPKRDIFKSSAET